MSASRQTAGSPRKGASANASIGKMGSFIASYTIPGSRSFVFRLHLFFIGPSLQISEGAMSHTVNDITPSSSAAALAESSLFDQANACVAPVFASTLFSRRAHLIESGWDGRARAV